MAALSYYSNWEPLQHMDSDIITMLDPVTQPPELPPELTSSFPDAWNVDYLLHSDDYFYSDNLNSVQFDFPNGIPSENLTAEQFSIQQEVEPFKRQKGCISYEELCSDDLLKPCFSNGLAQNPCLTAFQDYSPPLPVFPTVYSGGSYETCLSKEPTAPAPAGSLSAQSIAARQRRRKITEKTHELGKLVPGGQKMNTAEMLQSAHKYIKFLQAQVRVLEFVASFPQVIDWFILCSWNYCLKIEFLCQFCWSTVDMCRRKRRNLLKVVKSCRLFFLNRHWFKKSSTRARNALFQRNSPAKSAVMTR